VSDDARLRAERELAEARSLLETGEARRPIKLLEEARKGFLQANDLAGLQELRRTVEDGYRGADDADEPAYERLLYASAQNIRFVGRRRAAAQGLGWEDPHPELDAPGRPEIRAERGLGKRDVPWIVIGPALGATLLTGFVLLWLSGPKKHDRSILNDYPDSVVVGLCKSPCYSVSATHLLGPGTSFTFRTSSNQLIAVSRPSGGRIGCVDPKVRLTLASSAGRC
jgi:hypothetical protein